MSQALRAKDQFLTRVNFTRIPLSGILVKYFLCALCGSAVKSLYLFSVKLQSLEHENSVYTIKFT
jgi:hypothetical protein